MQVNSTMNYHCKSRLGDTVISADVCRNIELCLFSQHLTVTWTMKSTKVQTLGTYGTHMTISITHVREKWPPVPMTVQVNSASTLNIASSIWVINKVKVCLVHLSAGTHDHTFSLYWLVSCQHKL